MKPRRAVTRRSAPDQLDPALVESGCLGRRSGVSERTRNATRRIDQCAFEQPLPSLRSRPLVRTRGEGPVAGRSPTGALYRRLCDLLPISIGRHPRTGGPATPVGEVRSHSRADQDQVGRVWSVRAKTRGKRGRNRPETIYFLGLTLYCTRNQRGNFKVGMRTEKSRLKRSLMSLQELMRRIRHYKISDQADEINVVLRGHYGYYGVAGNLRSLVKVYRAVERYWRGMLRSRSWAGRRLTWDAFNQVKERTPLLKPKLRLPYRELQALAVL